MDSALHCLFFFKGFVVCNINFCICFWKRIAFSYLNDGKTMYKGMELAGWEAACVLSDKIITVWDNVI